MNFLAILRLIFSLLPILHQAIDQIETLFPEGGNGKQKLDMVKAIVEGAMNAGDTGGVVFSNIWPMLAGMVGDIVALKNKVGAFGKTSAVSA